MCWLLFPSSLFLLLLEGDSTGGCSWNLHLSLAEHRKFVGSRESSVFKAQATSFHRCVTTSSLAKSLGLLELTHQTSNVTAKQIPHFIFLLMELTNLVLYPMGWDAALRTCKCPAFAVPWFYKWGHTFPNCKLHPIPSFFSFLLPVLPLCLTFPLGHIFLTGLLPKWSGYFSNN